MDFTKLHNFLTEAGLPAFREKQIRQAYFLALTHAWENVTVLPAGLREKLKTAIAWDAVRPAKVLADKKNDSLKAGFELEDGEMIETVLIRHRDGRNTVCVSSQVGCPLGCRFCATGRGVFKRNLTAYEIVDQVVFFARHLKQEAGAAAERGVTNVVFMGMGEPLLNYDNVMRAVKILNDKEGFNLGARHISISTCGIVPGIIKLAKEKLQVNLAWSLHAADNRKRSELMPINDRYSLEEVLGAIDRYAKAANRRVMIEYLLIAGVNDAEKDADRLQALFANRPLCYLNLIPYNPTGARFSPADRDKVDGFSRILTRRKIANTIRLSFGQEIGGACGQLVGR